PINYFVRNTKFLKLIEGDLDDSSINIILDENHFQINLIKFGFDNKLLICRDIVNETLLEETRKQFISDVSHELKTPLTVILGNAELLLDRQSKKSEDIKLIEPLINQAERMNYLIKDLMALSSIDALKKNLRNEKIFITELFKQINEDLSFYSNKNNNIYFSCEAKSNKNLIGSNKEIKSAIQNLVSNAFRYTEKGFIKVTWYEEKFNGILSVKDTGIGIPKEHINKVTERFYRVNPDRSRNTGGTGLGLAIVQNIMDSHNGFIEIISDGKSGTEFKLIFPKDRISSK
ncbi:MAG: ATP-binding protein, partial [Methylophilaceae bacterium]